MNKQNSIRPNSILMTCYYPDLGNASHWLRQISFAARPIRSTTQIWVVIRHQYEITALVPHRHFAGKPVTALSAVFSGFSIRTFLQENRQSRDTKYIYVDSVIRTNGVRFALVRSLPRKLKLTGDDLIL